MTEQIFNQRKLEFIGTQTVHYRYHYQGLKKQIAIKICYHWKKKKNQNHRY